MGYRVKILPLEQRAWFSIRGRGDALQSALAALNFSRSGWTQKIDATDHLNLYPIGPEHYVLDSELRYEDELDARLKSDLTDCGVVCTNISDLYAGFAVCGEDAAVVLSQATPLNLMNLSIETVAATEVFSLPAIVVAKSSSSYCLYIERSYAVYARQRLEYCALI